MSFMWMKSSGMDDAGRRAGVGENICGAWGRGALRAISQRWGPIGPCKAGLGQGSSGGAGDGQARQPPYPCVGAWSQTKKNVLTEHEC